MLPILPQLSSLTSYHVIYCYQCYISYRPSPLTMLYTVTNMLHQLSSLTSYYVIPCYQCYLSYRPSPLTMLYTVTNATSVIVPHLLLCHTMLPMLPQLSSFTSYHVIYCYQCYISYRPSPLTMSYHVTNATSVIVLHLLPCYILLPMLHQLSSLTSYHVKPCYQCYLSYRPSPLTMLYTVTNATSVIVPHLLPCYILLPMLHQLSSLASYHVIYCYQYATSVIAPHLLPCYILLPMLHQLSSLTSYYVIPCYQRYLSYRPHLLPCHTLLPILSQLSPQYLLPGRTLLPFHILLPRCDSFTFKSFMLYHNPLINTQFICDTPQCKLYETGGTTLNFPFD